MKPVFQVLVALIVITAIGALVMSFSLDGMVKSKLEDTTSQMMETSVKVSNVGISILDGSGTIEEVTINNPKGFSDNPAIKLQQIDVKMDLSSLLTDTVVIKNIEIKKPEVYFEQKPRGSNLNALTEKLDASSSTDGSLIVNYLLVKEGEVTLTTEIGGEKTVRATFSRFELNDIGRSGNNSMEQTLQQILKPILQTAAREAVKQGMLDKAKDKIENLLEN